jgi:RimJ/RimL family protein N-acetyltransferase
VELALRKVSNADRETYRSWINKIKAHQYMSRFYPKDFHRETFADSELFCWYVIVSNHQDIGTVWLEKERSEDDAATLGIMLGDEKEFGAGIGKKAVELAIKQAQSELEFRMVELNVRKTNTRAIRCYVSSGFKIIEDGYKLTGTGEKINFLHMRLELNKTTVEFN